MFAINLIALVLVIIGALNWGLVGFFNYNVISMIFGGSVTGDYTGFERFIFAIVGLAGLWSLSFFGRLGALCRCCKPTSKKEMRGGGCCGSHSSHSQEDPENPCHGRPCDPNKKNHNH